jgi:predicted MFS family arabinose efflux permease
VLSLNASAIYLGMGLAGVLGGLVIGAAGALALPVVGTVLGLGCVVLLLALRTGTRRAAVLVG